MTIMAITDNNIETTQNRVNKSIHHRFIKSNIQMNKMGVQVSPKNQTNIKKQ